MKIPKHWIHIGHDVIDFKQFKSVRNISLSPKPIGGLWASPFKLTGDYKSSWHSFTASIWGEYKNQKSVVFTFKKEARIYVIDQVTENTSPFYSVSLGGVRFSYSAGVDCSLMYFFIVSIVVPPVLKTR